jgi:hypothetical protein
MKNITRVSDDRYSRDLRRYNLALRMLRLAARPNTIRSWTGFSDHRVRGILRSYRHGSHRVPGIRRGPSPTHLGALLANPNLRSELTAMAGLCRVLGLIPAERISNARTRLPNIALGERLCHVLETFREIVPHTRLTLEELLLLVFALAEGDVWSVDHCTTCRAVILVDRLSVARRVCADCQQEACATKIVEHAAVAGSVPGAEPDPLGSAGVQQTLF